MSEVEKTIRDALQDLADGSLADRTEVLLGTIGYRSDRTIDFRSVGEFLEAVGADDKLAANQLATFEHWADMDIVFQVTNEEVAGASNRFDARQPADLFGSGQPAPRQFDRGVAKSFLFLAVDLKPGRWTALGRSHGPTGLHPAAHRTDGRRAGGASEGDPRTDARRRGERGDCGEPDQGRAATGHGRGGHGPVAGQGSLCGCPAGHVVAGWRGGPDAMLAARGRYS